MENFVIDDYFIQWINKKNMPKLQNINLSKYLSFIK